MVAGESELAYLREQWGGFNMLCRTSVRGYNPEPAPGRPPRRLTS